MVMLLLLMSMLTAMLAALQQLNVRRLQSGLIRLGSNQDKHNNVHQAIIIIINIVVIIQNKYKN
eukprot:scaffold1265_cov173-Ochromonas_danica.AAC.6